MIMMSRRIRGLGHRNLHHLSFDPERSMWSFLICLKTDGGNTNPEVISAMQRELYLEVPSFSDWNDLHALVPRGAQALFLLFKGIAWVWALHNSFGQAQSKARPDAACVIDPRVNEKTRHFLLMLLICRIVLKGSVSRCGETSKGSDT